jgi:hypothetical protein
VHLESQLVFKIERMNMASSPKLLFDVRTLLDSYAHRTSTPSRVGDAIARRIDESIDQRSGRCASRPPISPQERQKSKR